MSGLRGATDLLDSYAPGTCVLWGVECQTEAVSFGANLVAVVKNHEPPYGPVVSRDGLSYREDCFTIAGQRGKSALSSEHVPPAHVRYGQPCIHPCSVTQWLLHNYEAHKDMRRQKVHKAAQQAATGWRV